MPEAAGLAYREAGSPGSRKGSVMFVHGYPESSYMWRDALGAVAAAGWHGVALDLAGYGDSEPDPPGTWERHVESLERFVRTLALAPVVLVTHDWGVLIGLRWACDHPDAIGGLVISDGGFFADQRYNGLAETLRTPGAGEELVNGYTREGLSALLRGVSPGIDEAAVGEYWKGCADPTRLRGHLELYRSGDFEKLGPYEGALARLGLPTLVLWGREDKFSSPRYAHRYASEIPGAEVTVLHDAGHFVWEDEPAASSARLVRFLNERF